MRFFGSVTSFVCAIVLALHASHGAAPVAQPALTVPSSDRWSESGFRVEEGKCYRVEATGKWRGTDGKMCGPRGVCPDAAYDPLCTPALLEGPARDAYYLNWHPRSALIGRFEEQRWNFTIGDRATFLAPVSGVLHFRINDTDLSSSKRTGSLRVTISEVRPQWVDRDRRTRIAASIDAVDYLHFTPQGVAWEYGGSWARVGEHGGVNSPTLINDIMWWPKWPERMRSETLAVKELWPGGPAGFKLERVEAARGTVRVHKSDANDIALHFEDGGGGPSRVSCVVRLAPVTIASPGRTDDTPAEPAPEPTPAQPDSPDTEETRTARSSIEVPSAIPTSTRPQLSTATTAPSDGNAIERPAYRDAPKALIKSQATVRAMVVKIQEDGDEMGFTSDIIATVDPDSRRSNHAGIRLLRGEGDANMRTTLEEAVRAIKLRYPIWEPGYIELSFGEKFTLHGGPSAGTAFALLMLSILEGVELDPSCAVTGDITVDWKVRPVGGVTAKLRGATLDKCQLAVIPVGHEMAFADMGILYGKPAIWNIQVFTASRVQDALAVARTDRKKNLSEAIRLFSGLQLQLAKSEKLTLQAPETRKTLTQILELAPNHLSARRLLALCDGTAAPKLSANGTMYRLSVLFYPYREILYKQDHLDRTVLPASTTAVARKRLAALRPIADPTLAPLITDMGKFIDVMDAFAAGTAPAKAVKLKFDALQARLATLNSDVGFAERLVREGY